MLQAVLILSHTTITILFVMNAEQSLTFIIQDLEEVEHLASHVTGFKVNSHRLEVYGTCPTCAGTAQSN